MVLNRVGLLWLVRTCMSLHPIKTLEFIPFASPGSSLSGLMMIHSMPMCGLVFSSRLRSRCRFLGRYFCVAPSYLAWQIPAASASYTLSSVFLTHSSCFVPVPLLPLWTKTCFQAASRGIVQRTKLVTLFVVSTALCCLLKNIWKQSFHIICLVF